MLSNLLFLLTFKEGISNSYFDFRGVASPMIFQDSTPMSSLMCAAQDSPQPRPLRGEKHPFPSRSSCASMRCLCRPNWVCFFFSAFPQFLASTSLEWRQNQFSLSWGLTAVLDSLTAGSHWPNRACLGFRWCRFSTRPAKLLTGPHKAESGFTAFFSQPFSVEARQTADMRTRQSPRRSIPG